MNTFFKKSTLAAMMLAVAIPATVSTSSTARADAKEFIAGAIIGGVIAKEVYSHKKHRKAYKSQKQKHHVKKHRHHAPKNSHGYYKRAHVNWCFDNYRTYDVRSNTFKDYDGYIKKCHSPYS